MKQESDNKDILSIIKKKENRDKKYKTFSIFILSIVVIATVSLFIFINNQINALVKEKNILNDTISAKQFKIDSLELVKGAKYTQIVGLENKIENLKTNNDSLKIVLSDLDSIKKEFKKDISEKKGFVKQFEFIEKEYNNYFKWNKDSVIIGGVSDSIIIKRAIRANEFIKTYLEEYKYNPELGIHYVIKRIDNERIDLGLKMSPYRKLFLIVDDVIVNGKRVSTWKMKQTNALTINGDVDINDIKLISLIVIRSGFELRGIKLVKRNSVNHIRIEHINSFEEAEVYTTEEIVNASSIEKLLRL